MAYRRTENVVRRLAAREQTIVDAARSIAGESGMGAVHIAAVANRADIAAGTVYRYFPSKAHLVAELISASADREVAAMRAAADAAPGPLSALAACLATFASRALHERGLAWAVIAEPIDADIDALRLEFRRALSTEIEMRIRTAIAGGHLPDQDARVAAPAILGALLEGLLGPSGAACRGRRRRRSRGGTDNYVACIAIVGRRRCARARSRRTVRAALSFFSAW